MGHLDGANSFTSPQALDAWQDGRMQVEFDTPVDARAYKDDLRLTPAQERRFEAWIKNWESEQAQDFITRLDQHSEAIAKEVTLLDEAAAEACREASKIPQDLRTGRITSKDALQKLAALTRTRDSVANRLASISENVERWESNTEADPSDLLRERQARFAKGAPSYGKRAITAAILRGESS